MRATRDVDRLIESGNLIGLGAAADERRRLTHGDRATFVRVQEVPASLATARGRSAIRRG